MNNYSGGLPAGISILRYFYLLNASFFILVILLFYEYVGIMALGNILPPFQTIIAKWVLIFLPLYIYFDLKIPNPRVFSIILCYHLFFLINNIFTVSAILNKSSNITPLLQVVNINERSLDISGGFGYTLKYTGIHIGIHGLSILIGFIILFYIWWKKDLFLKKAVSE